MITQGVVAIQERRSRLSYGVVCDQVYKEEKHIGEHVVRDPRDGKRWAKAQIEWIIKQASNKLCMTLMRSSNRSIGRQGAY